MMHPSDIQWWKSHSADYVLGLLSDSERLVFERIMPTEPELQEFVVDWREKLQPMSDALPPIKPPDHILPTLLSNIPATADHNADTERNVETQGNSLTQDKTTTSGTALVVASSVPDSANGSDAFTAGSDTEFINLSTTESAESRSNQANDQPGAHPDAPSSDDVDATSDAQAKSQLKSDADASQLLDGTAFMRMLERKQNGIDGWRSFAGLATVAGLFVAMFGWMGFQQAQVDRIEPTFDGISIVQNNNATALWVVDTAADAKKLRVTAVAPPVLEEGKAFELWMVKPNDGGVVSMGLLPSSANASVQINAHRFNAEAESFGVSVEPANGSSESIPTGPILYQGKIQVLSE